MMPPISVGMVTAHAPNQRGVYVTLRTSAQALGWPVRMGSDSYADGLRISQRPLPALGTWGVISFPYGDERNGIWLRSYTPSLVDAVMLNNNALDPFIDYESSFSGFWKMLDGAGNYAAQWPDGTSLVLGATSGLPALTRRTVDQHNKQVQTPYTQAQRVPNPPAPFVFSFTLAAGTSMSTDSSGTVTVSGAINSQLNLTFHNGAIRINAFGVNIDTTSLVNITLNGAPAADALALVSKLVAAFNIHTHSGGGAGTPTTPWSAATVESAVAKISS